MMYMVGFPISWVVCYAMFAFVNLSWAAVEWSETARTLCAINGMVWGVALSYRIKRDASWCY